MTGHENAGYRRLFSGDGLPLGAVFPLTERAPNRTTPPVDREMALAVRAESVEWIASHGAAGFYHLPRRTLGGYLHEWREVGVEKRFAMEMGVELAETDPEPIHQGIRARSQWFLEYLRDLDAMGSRSRARFVRTGAVGRSGDTDAIRRSGDSTVLTHQIPSARPASSTIT
ncbi:MAG: hypothetical protein QXG03_05670 [Halalkalicoccus sp.]